LPNWRGRGQTTLDLVEKISENGTLEDHKQFSDGTSLSVMGPKMKFDMQSIRNKSAQFEQSIKVETISRIGKIEKLGETSILDPK